MPFSRDLRSALKPGEAFSVTTKTGDTFSGRVEFVRQPRGFFLTVRGLNDAFLWITIEGAHDKIEVQAWLSAISLPPSKVEAFGKEWQQLLQEIFQN
jgi:hypothetical protein